MATSSNISRRRRTAQADGGPEYAAKREELVRIAAHLFKAKGFSKTRLIDIANEAGMDRASVYYYVGSKEELFREAIEGMLNTNLINAQAVVDLVGPSLKDKLTQIVELLMVSYEVNYPQMYVYIQEQMHQVAHEEGPWAMTIRKMTRDFEKLVRGLIQEGIDAVELRSDIPVRLASNALFGMFNWTHRWFTPDGPTTARDIAQSFASIFFDGFCAPARVSKPRSRSPRAVKSPARPQKA